MASLIDKEPEFSSLYKSKKNPIFDLSNQEQRRKEVLKLQKEKRESILLQLRSCSINTENNEQPLEKSPSRSKNRNRSTQSPIGMMLAEWLFTAPDDISSWFIIPCPQGQRCLVVHQSNKTVVYNKYGRFIRQLVTKLPKQSIIYCIYDQRTDIYHIIDIIMWNGCDYSIQIECSCRFFMLQSLEGDPRLTDSFKILPRLTINDSQAIPPAEDGYLFYHPLGFYETGYSPLVCWLEPFMVEEILNIKLPFTVTQPDGYTVARDYMLKEQAIRKDRENNFSESRNQRKSKNKEKEIDENEIMATEQNEPPQPFPSFRSISR